jgi:hypothetical protein
MPWCRGLTPDVLELATKLIVKPLLQTSPFSTLVLPDTVSSSLCHYPSAFYQVYVFLSILPSPSVAYGSRLAGIAVRTSRSSTESGVCMGGRRFARGL